MTKRLLVSLMLVLAATGCESPVDDAELHYVERIVVDGVLVPGKPVADIYVGRTLPLNVASDPRDAELHDAVVSIDVDGVGYPLRHAGNGLYENTDLLVASGAAYDLTVEWQGLKATAHTRIPYVPQWDTSSFTWGDPSPGVHVPNTLDIVVAPHPGETYGGGWVHSYHFTTSTTDFETDFNTTLKRESDRQADGRVHVDLTGYFSFSWSPHDTLWVTLSAFDEQFYAYFNSSGGPTSFEDLVLGVNPGGVNWNVTGDGIGLFIGKASMMREVVVR